MKTPLDWALGRALRDPGACPEFYKLLVESDVYTVTANSAADLRTGRAASGGLKIVQYESNGETIIPFYTSPEMLEKALKSHPGWVRLRARDFFRLTRHSHVVLNAGLDRQWPFCPADTEALLEGPKIPSSVFDPEIFDLGPAPHEALPESVVSALKSYCAKQVGVRAAYALLARARTPDASDINLVVIDLDIRDEVSEIIEGIPFVMRTLDEVTPDLLRVVALRPGEVTPVREYIDVGEVSPFYLRQIGIEQV